MVTTFHTPVFDNFQLGLNNLRRENQTQVFTAVSGHLAKLFSKFNIDVKTVYNGIDLNNWTYTSQSKGNQVCWFGRICKEKAPHLAIEAALKANSHIVLAGPISNEEYYKDFIEHHLDHKLVSYAGHLHQNEINELLGASSAMLFTSVWQEPYGLTIAESLACGTPVISWNLGASPEILDDTCGILVDAINTSKMALAIIAAKSLDRSACRTRAENFCSAEAMTRAYIKLYVETIYSFNSKSIIAI
jgi:UDP-glucose:tetrahydrobiopterin glucosyltransferase